MNGSGGEYLELRRCRHCGGAIPLKRLGREFCSKDCRNLYHREHPDENVEINPGEIIKTCEYCHAEFVAKTRGKVYCSARCVELANWERTHHDRYIIFERDGFRCAYCGRSSFEHGVTLHVDHVYPRSLGGKDTASNLITACSECNLAKKNNPPKDINPLLLEVMKRNKSHEIPPNTIIYL